MEGVVAARRCGSELPKKSVVLAVFQCMSSPHCGGCRQHLGFLCVFVQGKEAAAENCREAQGDNVDRHCVETRALCSQW